MAFPKNTDKALLRCLALLFIWGASLGNAKAQEPDSVADPIPDPICIAVFSYEKAYNSMADEINLVKENVKVLQQQYADELKRAEGEFNRKYEDFLNSQAKMAKAIRNKRQAEIQNYLESNMAFKAEALQAIKDKEAELLAPIKQKLQLAIETIGKEYGYTVILNKDNEACPYFNPALVTDITEHIIEMLHAPQPAEAEEIPAQQ